MCSAMLGHMTSVSFVCIQQVSNAGLSDLYAPTDSSLCLPQSAAVSLGCTHPHSLSKATFVSYFLFRCLSARLMRALMQVTENEIDNQLMSSTRPEPDSLIGLIHFIHESKMLSLIHI